MLLCGPVWVAAKADRGPGARGSMRLTAAFFFFFSVLEALVGRVLVGISWGHTKYLQLSNS